MLNVSYVTRVGVLSYAENPFSKKRLKFDGSLEYITQTPAPTLLLWTRLFPQSSIGNDGQQMISLFH